MEKFGLLFDCDGTLVDSLGAATESFNYALKTVGEAPRHEEEIKRYFGTGADKILTNIIGNKKIALTAFEAYLTHQKRLTSQMKLHDGIFNLLSKLSDTGIAMGIVTGRHERDLEMVLQPHNISNYFEVLISDSHVVNSKPAPEGILLATNRLKLKPENVLYIGDSVTDIQAAYNAGCGAIAATWDTLANEEIMRAENPRYVAKKPDQVLEFLLAFTKTST